MSLCSTCKTKNPCKRQCRKLTGNQKCGNCKNYDECVAHYEVKASNNICVFAPVRYIAKR